MLDCTDEEILSMLKKAKAQHHSYGVGTQPGLAQDADLEAALNRLLARGLVSRQEMGNDLVWWQSTD